MDGRKNLGTLGLRALALYFGTTALAIGVILIVMNLFEPGAGFSLGQMGFDAGDAQELSLGEFLSGMIPENILKAFIDGNAMQLVVLAFIFGFAALRIAPAKRKKVFHFSDSTNENILSFTKLIMLLTPFGVFGLIASLIAESGVQTIVDLWRFVLAILGALFFHALVILPTVAFLFGRFNPFKYFRAIKRPILVAFSTASSSAALPISMSDSVEKGKIDRKVADFVFPLGSTVNMDGTALYQAGVALFVAQALGVELDVSKQMTIVIATVLASVGASGIPGAGIVMLTTVFASVGLQSKRSESLWP